MPLDKLEEDDAVDADMRIVLDGSRGGSSVSLSNSGTKQSVDRNCTIAVIPNTGNRLPNFAMRMPPSAALPLQLNMMTDSTAAHMPRSSAGT